MEAKKNVIAFLNMKGGVCKTTLCKEIALYLSNKKGKKVLVIDIDPQSNCTQSLFERYAVVQVEEGDLTTLPSELPSIERIFSKPKGGLKPYGLTDIIYELEKNLHLVPGDLNTVFMERETGTGSAEQKLYNFIEEHELKNRYDYIFIDCPPTYSFYTISALISSNFYFVPLKPDIYSLLGLDLLERVVSDLTSAYRANFKDKPINNLGVIFTLVPKIPNKGIQRNITQIKDAFSSKEVYFFNREFIKVEKLATGKLSTFIIDREDQELLNVISDICDEFEKRMEEIG